jgi:transcriptional regulator with XRE-family HTH domain
LKKLSYDQEYSKFIDELSTYLQHYKKATGKSDRDVARAGGMSQSAFNRAKRGIGSPNLRTFYRVINATGRGEILGRGSMGVKLHAVSTPQLPHQKQKKRW